MVLVAIDKFKGSFSSKEIGYIVADILKQFGREAIVVPVSDGGDGFLEAIEFAVKGIERVKSLTYDPLMRRLETYFLFQPQKKEAYIELAKSGSLYLLQPEERNPMYTTSYGLGVQILQAIKLGAKKIFVGLGGSSTNDMGIGMAAALGWKFLDSENKILEPIGKNLIKIRKILPPIDKYEDIEFFACVDVSNPLFGKDGAAYVYAPQKGANYEEVIILDKGLRNLANLLKDKYLSGVSGDGAAGGLGAGMRIFLNAKIIDGAEFIIDLGVRKWINKADLVITGEGKLDFQSIKFGKLPIKIYKLAKNFNKNVIIMSGQCSETLELEAEIICLFSSDEVSKLTIEQLKAQTISRLKKNLSKLLSEKM